MPGLDSEALDFRAASESFAPVRKLGRGDLETLRLVTVHQERTAEEPCIRTRKNSTLTFAGMSTT
jgi:hypothetical protein